MSVIPNAGGYNFGFLVNVEVAQNLCSKALHNVSKNRIAVDVLKSLELEATLAVSSFLPIGSWVRSWHELLTAYFGLNDDIAFFHLLEPARQLQI